MIHGRTDYDPIQDPRGLIGKDEPVFLLRAKDSLMPAVLDFYVSLLKTHLNDVPFVEAVEAQKALTLAWQAKNGKQYPDILPAFYRNQPGPPPTPEGGLEGRIEALPTPPSEFHQPAPVGAKGWTQNAAGVWSRVTPPAETPAPAPVIVAESPASPLDELEIVTTPVLRKPDSPASLVVPYEPIENLPSIPLAEFLGNRSIENDMNAPVVVQTPTAPAKESDAMKQRPETPLAEAGEKLMMGQPKPHTPGVPDVPPVKHDAGKVDDDDEETDGGGDRPSLAGE